MTAVRMGDPARGGEAGVPGALSHDERLWMPPWMVAVLIALVLAMTVAYGAAGGLAWAAPITLIGLALVTWIVLSTATRVRVDSRGLWVGRAHLTPDAMGAVRALGVQEARQVRGPRADPTAFLVLRGWVATAVVVEVDDPEDPHPYWYVSTRHPARLAEALRALRAGSQRT